MRHTATGSLSTQNGTPLGVVSCTPWLINREGLLSVTVFGSQRLLLGTSLIGGRLTIGGYAYPTEVGLFMR